MSKENIMVLFQVDGMGCGSCVSKIVRGVQAFDGAAKVTVDRVLGQVAIDSEASPQELIEVLDELGYPARLAA